jgi:putative glutathione S-transferase
MWDGLTDRAEEHLSTRRYLAGSTITEADIRLFVTLVRFDEVSTP